MFHLKSVLQHSHTGISGVGTAIKEVCDQWVILDY